MPHFLDQQRTLENYWRAVIRSCNLADPFSRHIVDHLPSGAGAGAAIDSAELTSSTAAARRDSMTDLIAPPLEALLVQDARAARFD